MIVGGFLFLCGLGWTDSEIIYIVCLLFKGFSALFILFNTAYLYSFHLQVWFIDDKK